MQTTKDIGDWGEERAVEYLLANGFELRHRNWRNGRYELDVVAQKNGTLHFVEVKCRKLNSLTTPREAMTDAKSQFLFKAAEAYIKEFEVDLEIQFDLVAVEYCDNETTIEYVPQAILPRW